MSEPVPWWETQSLPVGSAGRWVVGPTAIWIRRRMSEWQVVHEQATDPIQSICSVTVPVPAVELEQHPLSGSNPQQALRFATSSDTGEITVKPALADRSIVVRPDSPFFVLPHEEIVFYVSTPLWLQVQIGNSSVLVYELPSFRLQDTWLGPPTDEGELCYSTTTAGRLVLEELPILPHRALTQIVVRNLSGQTLAIERLKLQVQHLSLYVTETGNFWTQTAILEGDEIEQLATTHFKPGPPDVAEPLRMIAGPRAPSRPTIVRRFTSLFGI